MDCSHLQVVQDANVVCLARQLASARYLGSHAQRRSMNLKNRSKSSIPKSNSTSLLDPKVSNDMLKLADSPMFGFSPRSSFAPGEPVLRRLSARQPPTPDDKTDEAALSDDLIEVRLRVPSIPRRVSVRSNTSKSDAKTCNASQTNYASNYGAYQLPLDVSATASMFSGIKKRRLRLVVLGARGVGKTSIIEQFVCGSRQLHAARSLEPRHYYPIVVTNDCLYDLQITECPPFKRNFPKNAEDEFLHFRGYGLRRASCYILVYDVANHDSFEYIRSLREQIQDFLNLTCANSQQKTFAKIGKMLSNATSTVHAATTADCGVAHSHVHKNDASCTASIIVVGNKVDLTASGDATQTNKKQHGVAKVDCRQKQRETPSVTSNGSRTAKDRQPLLPLPLPLSAPKRKSKSETDAPCLSSLFSAHHLTMQNVMIVPKILSSRANQSSASTTASVSSLANLVLAHRAHANSPSLLLDHAAFVKKYWKVTHVEVSAKFNWHVSQLFKDVIRVIDESENRHTNGKKSHTSMHFRFNLFRRQKDNEN